MGRRLWLKLGALALFGCAGSPTLAVRPLYKDGVRQRALTEDEALRMLRAAGPMYETCYRREMLNRAQALSNFVFIVWIPNDGSGAEIEMQKATVKGQITLQECLEEAMSRIRFPAHTGESLTLRVPLEGPA